jgi:hypothetical protein
VWISSLYSHKIQHGLELKIVLSIENDGEPKQILFFTNSDSNCLYSTIATLNNARYVVLMSKDSILYKEVFFETPSITILVEKALQFANSCTSSALTILQSTSSVLIFGRGFLRNDCQIRLRILRAYLRSSKLLNFGIGLYNKIEIFLLLEILKIS